MRVTSSSVFSPVRTRYVTDTQSGAWPANVATVRSSTSTSLSSRGAMNSNEIVGLLRPSMSAMRMARESLPQEAGVSDAASHAQRVQVFEQREHRPPARAHAIAQLRDGHRTVDAHDLLHHRDRGIESALDERNVVAHANDVPALGKRSHELLARTALLHRPCKEGGVNGLAPRTR